MKKPAINILCILLLLTLAASLFALGEVPEKKVVRVGWYESAFHRTDKFGRRSGYGYEYQQRIATFTGWEYEYVEGSWSELFEMLVNGEIDLLSDVSYTEERAQKILYSSEIMGSEDYHAFITPNNTDIRPDDFSTFDGKRVGVNKSSIQEQMFIEWAESHDVHPEIVELTAKTPELLDMLARGEIDVLVTLDTYGHQADVLPVCKVGYAESFFGINKDRPDLKRELDVAMNRILEDNRNFNQQLTEKFNEASSISGFLTPEEKDWVTEHDTIRVGYRQDYLPFCGLDDATQTLTGALLDVLTFAETCEKNAKLNFEPIPFATMEEGLEALNQNEVDCLFPVNLSAYDGEKLGVIVTDPYIRTEIFAAVRTADQRGVSPDQEMSVAVVRGRPNFETFLKDHYPDWKTTYYDDSEKAFEAVGTGRADCTLVTNYRLNRMNEQLEKHRLAILATGQAMDMSFAVRRADDCLYSILNKISRLIPEAAINSSLTNYSFSGDRVTFGEFLRDNLAGVVAILAIVASIILLLLLYSVRTKMKAKVSHEIITEAERDRLTNLYNRSFFMVYANRLHKEHPNRPMDAIVMNIERFHMLNTVNGRAYGDEVLQTLAKEIEDCLPLIHGIAGRMEGDHFDIYCAHQEDYQLLLNRFQSSMNTMAKNADIKLRMGVMPWQKDIMPERMFDLAWSACSMIRGDYKTHLMIYDDELRRRDQYNQRLQNDLGRALNEGELQVYYQPKYDIQREKPKLSSAEALIRWKHSELGMISPGDFIPLFERSGQISVVDKFVWNEAARQVAAWRAEYGFILPVSVNLSRVDVFDPNLPGILDGILARHNLPHTAIKLEVTESAYTENASHLIRVIEQLREEGYEIEMDDFGSGYSSLNMLSSMPIDVLKMDMAFVKNIEFDEREFHLVELILDIARYLRVPVVAEGVETENQMTMLKNAGCALVQGYYFSRPLPADEFAKKIIRRAMAEV